MAHQKKNDEKPNFEKQNRVGVAKKHRVVKNGQGKKGKAKSRNH